MDDVTKREIAKYLTYYHEGVDITLNIQCCFMGWWFWNHALGKHEQVSLVDMRGWGWKADEMCSATKMCRTYYIGSWEMFYHLLREERW